MNNFSGGEFNSNLFNTNYYEDLEDVETITNSQIDKLQLQFEGNVVFYTFICSIKYLIKQIIVYLQSNVHTWSRRDLNLLIESRPLTRTSKR